MSPEEITSHEPTAVKRDPHDQKIAKGGKTGTDSAEAKEKYRKELAKQNIKEQYLSLLFLLTWN
ncbi:MAG TPA: hypothetical protein VFP49_01370 [Nitrososphaeraceae archaeon]|jgi:hypothetical protein|nr:hypothetical protein [Nitrososphaeraceae archaeon]